MSNSETKVKNSFKDISFELREGEILGVAGLVGAKRTEVVEALFGLREIEAGEVQLHGRHIKVNNPIEAIKHGFALITEERRVTGIFGKLNISFNSVISNIEKYANKLGLLDDKKMKTDTQWVIDSMSVKTPGQKTLIGNLSGGNQQHYPEPAGPRVDLL